MKDRALFDLAIDTKLRGCDLVKIKIGTLVTARKFELVPWSSSRRLGVPYSLRLRRRSGQACLPGLSGGKEQSTTMLFPVEPITPITSALASTLGWWMTGSLRSGCVVKITAHTLFGARRLR